MLRIALIAATLVPPGVGAALADRGTPVRDCASRAEGPEPAADHPGPTDVLVGPLTFANLRSAARAPRSRFKASGPGRYPAYKVGVLVRAGRVATLVVPRSQRRRYALAYSPAAIAHAGVYRLRDGDRRVRLEACAAGEPAFSHPGPVGEVTAFPGGFVVAGARCVRLEVRVPGRARPYRRTISFGAGRCRR